MDTELALDDEEETEELEIMGGLEEFDELEAAPPLPLLLLPPQAVSVNARVPVNQETSHGWWRNE